MPDRQITSEKRPHSVSCEQWRAKGDWRSCICAKDPDDVAEKDRIDDHEFVPVAGHPDDNECTHRPDGTDATYCGYPYERHLLDVMGAEDWDEVIGDA